MSDPIERARCRVRANLPARDLINGEIVTVADIVDQHFRLSDGRSLDARSLPPISHGFAVTSRASRSKTVDYVIVAAEQLDAKPAYVACSRGKFTCTVHTPDLSHLLSHLPQGNRTTALDLVARKDLARLTEVQGRQDLWHQAKAYFKALHQRGSTLLRRSGERWNERAHEFSRSAHSRNPGIER